MEGVFPFIGEYKCKLRKSYGVNKVKMELGFDGEQLVGWD